VVEVGEENKSPWTAVHGSLVLHDERQTRQTHPAQWVGLKTLIRGLGVGGRKRKQKKKKANVIEKQKHKG
jgi:hypothetical protein